MTNVKRAAAAAGTALALVVCLGAAPGEPVDLAEMMKRAKRFTTPGPQHDVLKRFVGTWDTATTLVMPGGKPPKAEKGTATFEWMMKGRWLQFSGSGQLMGQGFQNFGIMGYDNFKQSFVYVDVSNIDTAMRTAEGDLDPGGKAMLLYGTIDEYLTGEHDKMVKYVWRFSSPNRLVLEVHDLPIGEKNTKVVETVFTKRR